jgi:hypothetical protein
MDNDYDWTDSFSPPQVEVAIPEEFGFTKKTKSFHWNDSATPQEDLNDLGSFGTVDSEDPTHEAHELSQNSASNKIEIQDPNSPPQLQRTPKSRLDSPSPAKASSRTKAQREDKLARARKRLDKSIAKARKANETVEMQTATAVQNIITTTPGSHETEPNTPIRNNQNQNDSELALWKVVGPVKRKAKDSPSKPHPIAIRKSPTERSSKKHIVKARASPHH